MVNRFKTIYNLHMGRYLVIDREQRSVELINESIKTIDSQAQFENFGEVADFENHIKSLTPEALPQFWIFDMMILDYGFYTHQVWPEKIAALKSQNTKEASVVLTGYENTFTTSKFIRPLNIYNFIFKPFDSLILKESLNLALKINKKAQPLEMKSQSATAFIALLKDVELQTISELGFVTLSDSQIEIGSVSKYFSAMFIHGKKQSVWAQCVLSLPHPQKPGSFVNKFQFYAADQSFLNTLRRYIINHKSDSASSALWNFNPPKKETTIKMAFVGAENDENKAIAADLERKFPNLKVEFIKFEGKKAADAPLNDHQVVLNTSDIKQDQLASLFTDKTMFFWFTAPIQKEDDIKDLALQYKDIFIRPLDRSYFYKKLKIHLNDLKEDEQSHLSNITTREVMKVANKVKISEISELYVNLVYPRELPLKDFREFVFLSDDETQVVELPAFCHYTEKSQSADSSGGGGGFLHQFVFFGMTDHLLKQIRLWLLHNYIVQNQKD